MFRAGLYVGLGGFGMEMAKSVSRGSFDGRGGPAPFSGMPRGPSGFTELPPHPPASTPGIESGRLWTEEFDPLELGRLSSGCPRPRSFAKRSDRASAEEEEVPFVAVPTDDTARACRLSGLGETEGFTLGAGGAKTLSEPVLA